MVAMFALAAVGVSAPKTGRRLRPAGRARPRLPRGARRDLGVDGEIGGHRLLRLRLVRRGHQRRSFVAVAYRLPKWPVHLSVCDNYYILSMFLYTTR